MNEDNPFAFLRPEDPPASDWSLAPTDFEHFDPFGMNKTSFDFPSQNPPRMEIECPIPHIPLCGNPPPPPPPSPPPLRRSKPPPRQESRHKKAASSSGPEWFLWGSPNQHLRRCSLPDTPSLQLDSDSEFEQVCADSAILINPQKLGFIPTQVWSDESVTFGQLVRDFFQRKNHTNSRFSHKLYNALKITIDDPFYIEFVGIEWITDVVLRIDKRVFARLLAIKTVDGSLFHQQGNFPSHGFVELSERNGLEFIAKEVLETVDFDNVRLLVHQDGVFTRNCTEADIERCKWISAKKRNHAAAN